MQSWSLQRWVDFSHEDGGVFYPLPCKGSCCRGAGWKASAGRRGSQGLPPRARGCVSPGGALPSQPAPNRALFRALVAAGDDLLVALP